MNTKKILDNTLLPSLLKIGFQTEKDQFPHQECVIPYGREEGVWDSPDLYLCVVRTWRPGEAPPTYTIQLLRPYIVAVKGAVRPVDVRKMGFAWVGVKDYDYVDHFYRPAHNEKTRLVVAWKKVPLLDLVPDRIRPPKRKSNGR